MRIVHFHMVCLLLRSILLHIVPDAVMDLCLCFWLDVLGIRSLCFRDDVISIGTGVGSMFFYDLRAERYLHMECGHPFSLTMNKGWLVSNE